MCILFLLFNILADSKQDICGFLGSAVKGVVRVGLHGVRGDLLERAVRSSVHVHRDIDSSRSELDFLGLQTVRAAAGAGTAGLIAGVDSAVFFRNVQRTVCPWGR